MIKTRFTTGLDKFHFAVMTEDSESAVKYNVPVALLKAQKVDVSPAVSEITVSADDNTETESEVTGAEVSIQKSSLSAEERAMIFGENTINGINFSGEAPYGAFGYRRSFNDGTQHLIWILKLKFKESNVSVETKNKKSPNPQFDTVSATSDRRIYDNEWRIYKEVQNPTTSEINSFFSKATLETAYKAAAASQLYGDPAETVIVDALPETGESGVVYIVVNGESVTAHYWDGKKFVEKETAPSE